MAFPENIFSPASSKTASFLKRSVRLPAYLALVGLLWLLLLLVLSGPWKDLILWSEPQLQPQENSAYQSVFIQIDESFLQDDLPLTLQFRRWSELFDQIRKAPPAVVLLDFHFTNQRFESLVPGAADAFERSLQALAEAAPVVMGVSPAGPQACRPGKILQGCMLLVPDRDGVIRNHHATLDNECPEYATSTLAAVAAAAVGNRQTGTPISKQNLQQTDSEPGQHAIHGLVLTRGQQSVLRLPAGDVLAGRFNRQQLQGSILVIGSGFPFEDEHLSSHSTENVFFHTPVKGAVIHALHTEALLENRVAWEAAGMLSSGLLILAALLTVMLIALTTNPQYPNARSAAGLLLIATLALLLTDLVSIVYFKTWLNAFIPAALCLSAGLLLQVRNTVAELLLKRRIQGLLGGLLSPAVLKQCLANPDEFFQARRFENAAVLVLDLQGYTAAFSHNNLQEMHEQGSQFLGACTALVHARDGCVERFRGDGLLAYFGAPVQSSSAMDDALACALDILEQVRSSNSPVLKQFEGRIRFGISGGEVVLGRVGNSQRFDVSVTGLAANRAAHFESLADPLEYPVVLDVHSFEKASQPLAVKPLQQRHPKHPGLELLGTGWVESERADGV